MVPSKDGRLSRLWNRLKHPKTDSDNFTPRITAASDASSQNSQCGIPIHNALWYTAYKNLKNDQSKKKYVEAYEQLVAERFLRQSSGKVPFPDPDAGQPLSAQEEQMRMIIKEGLEKIKKPKAVVEKSEEVLRVMKPLMAIVEIPLKNTPQTSLPWAVISSTLDILANPVKAGIGLYNGIAFISSRMDRYTKLTDQLLDKKDIQTGTPLEALGSDLHEDILGLEHEDYGKCLRNIRGVDPRNQIKGIQEQEELIEDLYSWVLETSEYKQFADWDNQESPAMLWISGVAGTGKTRLLLGVIKELMRQGLSDPDPPVVLYFFCQRTDDRANTSVSILRSLIWLLLLQQPQLFPYIQSKVFQSGEKLITDKHAFITLREILEEMLADKSLSRTVFVIDAMDECEDATRSQLLSFLIETKQKFPKIKHLLSSRPWVEIPQSKQNIPIQSHSIIDFDQRDRSEFINMYIKRKMSGLKKELQHRNATFTDDYIEGIGQELQNKASNTFIWVSLVFKGLYSLCEENILFKPVWDEIVKNVPRDLQDLYTFLLERLDHALSSKLMSAWCKQVLAVAMLARRPLTLSEIELLALPEDLKGQNAAQRIVQDCQSFLTIRSETVYFIHQSAQDYLLEHSARLCTGPESLVGSDCAFNIHRTFHYQIFEKCLEGMKDTLKQDIYRLERPGTMSEEIETPNPDPLRSVRYACQYWAHHFAEGCFRTVDIWNILHFFKEHFLHWLEAMSLLGIFPESAGLIDQLSSLPQVQEYSDIFSFLSDAKRFILKNLSIAAMAPLQLYISALIFTPEKSIVRRMFKGKVPSWILKSPKVEQEWGALLQTLEHISIVSSVTFSGDSQLVISGSFDGAIKVWDTATGALQKILNHESPVYAIVLSPDEQLMASGTGYEILLWDTNTWNRVQGLNYQNDGYFELVFSPNSQILAARSEDSKVTVWARYAIEWNEKWTHMPSGPVLNISFDSNSEFIWLQFTDFTTEMWNVNNGTLEKRMEPPNKPTTVHSAVFSPDRQLLASLEHYECDTVQIWNTATWDLKRQIRSKSIKIIDISPNNELLALALDNKVFELWNIESGILQQTLKDHSSWTVSMKFSPDSRLLASRSVDSTVKLWDATLQNTAYEPSDCHSNSLPGVVAKVKFSPDGLQVATGSVDGPLKLWDPRTGNLRVSIPGISGIVREIAFSPDRNLVAIGSFDGNLKVWNTQGGDFKEILEPNQGLKFEELEFSADSKMIRARQKEKFKAWDVETGSLAIEDLTDHFKNKEIQSLDSDTEGEIFIRGQWILNGREEIIWLPPEYRLLYGSWDVHNDTVAIGHLSGHVSFISLDLDSVP
ncbi:hypothetical protein AWENTII_012852 [Aspergillus wentii]